jgi:hypothetical protein
LALRSLPRITGRPVMPLAADEADLDWSLVAVRYDGRKTALRKVNGFNWLAPSFQYLANGKVHRIEMGSEQREVGFGKAGKNAILRRGLGHGSSPTWGKSIRISQPFAP